MTDSPASDSAVLDRGSPEISQGLLRRAVGAAALGNATEWFDYGVYAYVATEIGHNFFPGEYSTLGALLVFAVSFILRPLGGIVWGPLGDRYGRSRILATTILLMCVATFLVGLLPTYEAIGIWAPILLIVLRVIQGFSTGGEYGGAATFMAEYAPDQSRGFWGSFLEFGTLAGFTAAVVLVFIIESIIGQEAMTEWGWRLPFLFSLPLGAVGLYLRLKMSDTPCFKALETEETAKEKEQKRPRLKELFSDYWRPILQLLALVIALNVTNYTLLAYMPTYLQETVGISSSQTDAMLIIGQVVMMIVIPFTGGLSDRIGRKPCWWISLGGLFVLAIPMFMLMSQGFLLAMIAFTVMGLIYLLQLGTISATFPAMFPTQVRYSGMAISYNVATAVFGGTALAANEALIKLTGSNLVPAYYMMGACVIGMIGLYFMIETKGASLHGRGIPGAISRPATGRRSGAPSPA